MARRARLPGRYSVESCSTRFPCLSAHCSMPTTERPSGSVTWARREGWGARAVAATARCALSATCRATRAVQLLFFLSLVQTCRREREQRSSDEAAVRATVCSPARRARPAICARARTLCAVLATSSSAEMQLAHPAAREAFPRAPASHSPRSHAARRCALCASAGGAEPPHEQKNKLRPLEALYLGWLGASAETKLLAAAARSLSLVHSLRHRSLRLQAVRGGPFTARHAHSSE